MNPPKVIVTGLGHAGSTYIMDIFDALGIDIGDGPMNDDPSGYPDKETRHGREWEQFLDICREMNAKMSQRHRFPYETTMDYEKLFESGDVWISYFIEKIDEIDFPAIVKYPDFGWGWLIDLFEPEYVIVCKRHPVDWIDSMQRWEDRKGSKTRPTKSEMLGTYTFQIGNVISSLEMLDIDYGFIDFPKSIESSLYLADVLKPALEVLGDKWNRDDIYNAYKNVVREDWIA